MTRHSGPTHHLIGVAGAMALAASALTLAASPAAAVGCPVVNPLTHEVMPAPAPDSKWQGCNLTNADLTNADLTGSNLSNANLNGADLFGATLTGVSFASADLSNANLAAAALVGADLTSATVNSANLNGADLSGATLTGVRSAGVLGVPAALPSPWLLAKGYLVGPGAQLENADLESASLHGADASGANLKNAFLAAADLSDALLVGANLDNAYLGFANLKNADLSRSILTESNVQFTDFTGATLNGVTSGFIDGVSAVLPTGWRLVNGYLLGFQANLRNAEFQGRDLAGVDLRQADLTKANFTDADLRGALLGGANLDRAVLAGAQLTGVVSGGITGTPNSLPVGWKLVGGYLIEPLSYLRVTTTPAVASQISIDGSLADSWGLRWVEVPAGEHTVCFGAVPGFATPACQTVTTQGLQTTTVDGAFTARGLLRAVTSPAVASQITVDGVPRDNWGMWTEFATGSHQVCFGAVKGFTPPGCQTVNVTAGATTTVTGTFTPNAAAQGQPGVGFLRVTTSPPVPSLISVDGNIIDTWGLNWMEITPGAHQVCFERVEGYVDPNCASVTVTAGATSTVVGPFSQRGFLKVETNPSVPGTISIDGEPADAWGVFTDVAPGTFAICFGDVPGKTTPACKFAVVTAGAQTTVVGNYGTPP